MTQQKTDHDIGNRGKGVRLTVTILASLAVAFFLLSFLQIVAMK
jgi:hypothetical protein